MGRRRRLKAISYKCRVGTFFLVEFVSMKQSSVGGRWRRPVRVSFYRSVLANSTSAASLKRVPPSAGEDTCLRLFGHRRGSLCRSLPGRTFRAGCVRTGARRAGAIPKKAKHAHRLVSSLSSFLRHRTSTTLAVLSFMSAGSCAGENRIITVMLPIELGHFLKVRAVNTDWQAPSVSILLSSTLISNHPFLLPARLLNDYGVIIAQ